MRDRRKPGVPIILELLNLLNSSDEVTTTTDDETQINNDGPSEELFHTADNLNTENQQNDSNNFNSEDESQIQFHGPSEELPHTHDAKNEENDSENLSEDYISDTAENSDSADFFSDNTQEHSDREQENNRGNPFSISSDSDPSSHSQMTTEFKYDGDYDTDSSDNSLRPFKRRKY